MPRAISSPLQTEFDKPVTSVGYFLQWNTSPIARWSNLGPLTWNSLSWEGYDFEVEGLRLDADRDPEAMVKIQNLDSAAAALFLNVTMADVLVDVYQVERDALAVGDVVKLAQLAVSDCDIGIDRVDVKLVSASSLHSFCPRRRVDPANGFSYAMPPESQIPWENEILVVESERG